MAIVKKTQKRVNYRELYFYLLNKQCDAISVLSACLKVMEEQPDNIDMKATFKTMAFIEAYMISGHKLCEEVVEAGGEKSIDSMKREFLKKSDQNGNSKRLSKITDGVSMTYFGKKQMFKLTH